MKIEQFIKENWRLTLAIFLLLCIIFYVDYSAHGVTYNLLSKEPSEAISGLLDKGSYSMLFFFLFNFIEVAFSMPGFIIYMAAATIFGKFGGFMMAFIGNAVASTAIFFFARKMGREKLLNVVSHYDLHKFDEYTEKHGALVLFFLRLNPFTSLDIWNYVAGLSNMKYWHFIISTMLGLIPYIYVVTFLGVTFSKMSTVTFYILFVLLALEFLIISVIITLFLKKHTQNITTRITTHIKNRRNRFS